MELLHGNDSLKFSKDFFQAVINIGDVNARYFKKYITTQKTLYLIPDDENRILFSCGYEVPSRYKDKRFCIKKEYAHISILQLRQLYNEIGVNISLERIYISVYGQGTFDGFKVIINE